MLNAVLANVLIFQYLFQRLQDDSLSFSPGKIKKNVEKMSEKSEKQAAAPPMENFVQLALVIRELLQGCL